MARVFYLGAPSEIAIAPGALTQDLLAATGNNTGNLLIGHAIKRQLKAEAIGTGMSRDPREIEAKYDYIVIGASNFMFKRFDFSSYADFLERVRLPCTIIGLGGQAPRFSDRVEVPPGTLRMLKIVSERSTSLGARGYFSASVLHDLGIYNVRVIGCPSMYWSCQPRLQLPDPAKKQLQKVVITGSANVVEHALNVNAAKRVEQQLARLSFDHGYPYVLQNEAVLMQLAAGETRIDDAKTMKSLMERYGVADQSPGAFVQFVRTRMRTYYEIDRWRQEMADVEFVLGTRFHGCLIAMLAGVPCFLFVHDSRTREMCELLRLPHARIEDVDQIEPQELYEQLDLSALRVAYRYLYQNYRCFLDENHVAHNLPTD